MNELLKITIACLITPIILYFTLPPICNLIEWTLNKILPKLPPHQPSTYVPTQTDEKIWAIIEKTLTKLGVKQK